MFTIRKIEDIKPDTIESVKKDLERLKSQYGDMELMDVIMKAIQLDKGHWNKCPNGHYYAIGDCGGAMEVSRCPDCKAQIGGKDHVLIEGNSFASDLGGVSAWNPEGFDARVARGEVDLNDI